MAPSYAHGAGAAPLLGETIGENLDRTIARFGDREALVSVHQDVRLTYDEFGQAVDRLARALLASGIRPGDRLGIWSPNCAEWVLVQYATAKAGIVLVNINPAYRTSELAFVLAQSGCRALVAARAFKSSNYAAMIAEVAPTLPGLDRVVYLESDEWHELLGGADAELPDAQFDEPINIVGTPAANHARSVSMSSSMRAGSNACIKVTVPLRESGPSTPSTQPPVWNIGMGLTLVDPSGAPMRSAQMVALFITFRWVSTAPFGKPVVPLVY